MDDQRFDAVARHAAEGVGASRRGVLRGLGALFLGGVATLAGLREQASGS
jgi:hypothetical protein